MVNLPNIPADSIGVPLSAQTWWWRLSDTTSTVIVMEGDFGDRRFPSQADAESWVGEFWADLARLGVEGVTLMDGDREVYGPMSLRV